jgi:hypothetical protein
MSAGWALLVVVVVPGINQGVPLPNCQSCACTQGVQAWRTITYDANGAPTTGQPTVLKAWDKNNPNVWGAVTPYAVWTGTGANTVTYVFAPNCFKNNNQAGTTTCKFLYYNENWAPTCALLANQPPSTKNVSYAQPVVFDPNSQNFTPGVVTTDSNCGKQN